ncbi:GNAT family N-acetyltransferase [Catenovulum sp. SM1970]|uniref:GNAT family N-acetyltransferase n=1 Tax=Marinifaba aquimaris TaxID=2741323 RepID=UPI0015727BA2|nr:GNAT family N-acetyltransferase [Marinifaba aquimaris]NTS76315.1 GNAT family N-acetyltransferase [Marinifaba aquimaris]
MWYCKPFNELNINELYEILRVRQEVFTVEQNCVYQDADQSDQLSHHLFTYDEKQPERIIAYARIVKPGIKYREAAIGRVLTSELVRGTGMGKKLMAQAVEQTTALYPKDGIRISAQQHLANYYQAFGFEQVSEPYDEDGIPHIEMLKPA